MLYAWVLLVGLYIALILCMFSAYRAGVSNGKLHVLKAISYFLRGYDEELAKVSSADTAKLSADETLDVMKLPIRMLSKLLKMLMNDEQLKEYAALFDKEKVKRELVKEDEPRRNPNQT